MAEKTQSMTEQPNSPVPEKPGHPPSSYIIELKTRGFTPEVFRRGRDPQNLGVLEDADGYAEVFGWCGEKMEIYLSLEKIANGEYSNDRRIAAARFVADGCISTMACGDMVTTLVEGRTVAEAKAITPELLQDALGGLPLQSMHCSELSVETLTKALKEITGED